MPRSIWSGTLSFGLLHVPIEVLPCERDTELKLRMLDRRNKAPIRYERLNSETGEKVEWSDIVKAYEYEKDQFVVLEEEELKAAAAEKSDAVEIEGFVDAADVSAIYCDKPYVLAPGKKAEKGYVLLRETLKRTGKVGVGRVVLRTKEHLAMIMPEENALLLILLRFPEELTSRDDYALPKEAPEKHRVNEKELEMASELVRSMSTKWDPEQYHDEFRARLLAVIEQRVSQAGVVDVGKPKHEIAHPSTNVVDFMALLKQSLDEKKGARAKPSVAKASAEKPERSKAGIAKTTEAKTKARAAAAKTGTKKRKAG